MTTSSPASTTPQLWVFCLCAQWCGTCREYQPLFDQLAINMPQARFVWVDVEEHDALLGELDIENLNMKQFKHLMKNNIKSKVIRIAIEKYIAKHKIYEIHRARGRSY